MENEAFNLIDFITKFINADSVWAIFGTVGIASAISAYVSSKSTAKNPILKAVDQLFRDLVNIIALNIFKAVNKDDDR